MSDFKAKLKQRGKSLRGWALERGYRPGTAYMVVYRWEQRVDRAPHGGLARQIMADLRRELEG